jgi:hypothetical protein
MNNSEQTKDKENQDKERATQTSEAKEPATLSLRPLPHNRPISVNVTEDPDELMGYLD